MRPFNTHHYPLSQMVEDAIVLLTPVMLTLVGMLLLE